MENMLGKAIAVVANAFKDVNDKGGHPYVLHCLRVMEAMPTNDWELRAIAVMHDLVEDTSWTLEHLLHEGFPLRVVNGVAHLTLAPNVTRDEYIKMIATSLDARTVKLADLRDNSDITRLKGLTKKDFDRIERYHREYVYLSKV